MKANLLQSIELSYQELYVDMALSYALNHGLVESHDKEYMDTVIRVHANVCYARLCFCVQLRANMKAELGVERQFILRRSAVTAHEIFKYLFGFNNNMTAWKKLERVLQSKYPKQCKQIAEAADDYLREYGKEANGVLRKVAKHFSNNPTEFFIFMTQVDEHYMIKMIATASSFLCPIHFLLVKELQSELGALYTGAMIKPMPKQTFEPIGIEKQKETEKLKRSLSKYCGIVNSVMRQIVVAQKIAKQHNTDMTDDPQWKQLTEDNIGLHIIYIYLDLMVTFLSFSHSESFAEYRQNLAYLMVSAHEGFKKMYGFKKNERENSYWNRSIKKDIAQIDDEQVQKEVVRIELRLEELSKDKTLSDEKMAVALTHNGSKKRQEQESPFAILKYFRRPVKREDVSALTDFMSVMKEIVHLYNKVLNWKEKQMRRRREKIFAGFYEMISKYDQKLMEQVKDSQTGLLCS